MCLHVMGQTRLQKQHQIPQNQYISFKAPTPRMNYQSPHLLLGFSIAKDFASWIKPLLSIYNFISCYLCVHLRAEKSCDFIARELRLTPKGFNTLSKSFKKQAGTVLSFGLCSQWPSASCCAPETETHWSRGMMAKLCDAGRRINKSFDWTASITASIHVA